MNSFTGGFPRSNGRWYASFSSQRPGPTHLKDRISLPPDPIASLLAANLLPHGSKTFGSESRPPRLCNFEDGRNQLKFPVSTHLAEIIVHQSLAKPWVTYLYDSHPYPAFAQFVPHEFRTSSAPLSLPIMRLSS